MQYQELIEFLPFLETLHSRSVAMLASLVHGEVMLNYKILSELLSSPELGQMLVELQDKVQFDSREEQLHVFYSIFVLRDILSKFPLNELARLLQIIHSDNISHIVSRLEGIVGVLSQLGRGSIQEIHDTLSINGDEQLLISRLREKLTLDDQHYHLYATLVVLFQEPVPVLHTLANSVEYITTSDTHWTVVSRLAGQSLGALVDLHSLLLPSNHLASDPSLPSDMGVSLLSQHIIGGDTTHEQENAQSYTLTVVEQPPERCVYKRNIKPGPVVTVTGGSDYDFAANLFMFAILVRCDSDEDCPNYLIGGQPQSLNGTRTIDWKRLKVTVTSHQQNETMFCLRFELRRFQEGAKPDDPDALYEVLATVSTNPILVLSHSTQLRVQPETLPTVQDIIPSSGPLQGFTKVVILGSDFVESPTTRVRFGNTEVHAQYHGPKTLICRTPSHSAGRVDVQVCNDPNAYSQSSATFFYDPAWSDGSGGISHSAVAFESGFETARVVQRS